MRQQRSIPQYRLSRLEPPNLVCAIPGTAEFNRSTGGRITVAGHVSVQVGVWDVDAVDRIVW